ncbi:hypothetical protein [Ferruginibacter sp.]|uniref:hypothetical protein n=1 Tax=Ferruginibacter sp. TaxID=1940288 RepID=UPI00374DE1F5
MGTKFNLPESYSIEYDLLAPDNKWVIKAVDGKSVDRDFDKWPLIDGVINK